MFIEKNISKDTVTKQTISIRTVSDFKHDKLNQKIFSDAAYPRYKYIGIQMYSDICTYICIISYITTIGQWRGQNPTGSRVNLIYRLGCPMQLDYIYV